jgi:hypothetical protein
MTLAAGARLGPYEVISLLGAGGPPSLARASYGASMRLS